MIMETIVTTRSADGNTHIAPMGLRRQEELFFAGTLQAVALTRQHAP